MNYLDKFKNRIKRKNMIDVSSVDDILLKALLQGDEITKKEAMSLPAVFSAVDLISNIVSMLPIKLYMFENGNKKEVVDDNRVFLLNNDTKDTLTGQQFKRNLVEDYLLDKGGYAYIKKQGNKVLKLVYIEPNDIQIVTNNEPLNRKYEILVNGKSFKNYEFIKILRNSKDGSSGESVIEKVSKAIETAYQTMLYQLVLLETGGNKRGFLKSEKSLSQEAIDKLKEAWKKLYSTNESNVVVLNNGVDFKECSNSSVEMQLNENKNTLNAEIDKIFHIKNNFNDTFKEAIMPILANIECSLNRDLLLEKEKGKLFFSFDLKEILKGSLKERFEAYKIAKETGWITLNEIRYLENYDKIDGLDIIAMSLGNVIYDTKTGTYFTPNTDSKNDLNNDKNKELKGGDEDGQVL